MEVTFVALLWKVWKAVGAIDENTEYAQTSKIYSSRIGDAELTLWNDLDRTEKELVEAIKLEKGKTDLDGFNREYNTMNDGRASQRLAEAVLGGRK